MRAGQHQRWEPIDRDSAGSRFPSTGRVHLINLNGVFYWQRWSFFFTLTMMELFTVANVITGQSETWSIYVGAIKNNELC
jgi:hypothetical protein